MKPFNDREAVMENRLMKNVMRLVVLASMLAIAVNVQLLLDHAFPWG